MAMTIELAEQQSAERNERAIQVQCVCATAVDLVTFV